MGSMRQSTWAVAVIAAVCHGVWLLMPGVSVACNIEYEAPSPYGTRYVSFETAETSRTINAAAQVVTYEINTACLSPTKSIGSCTGGCCFGMCGPVSLKVCTDGFMYTAYCPSGQSCNYSVENAIPWDLVCYGCVENSDCEEGQVCTDGQCASSECTIGSHSDCAPDEACL